MAEPSAKTDASEFQPYIPASDNSVAEFTVKAVILGGLIVRVGSRMIDSSLRMRLASLKAGMKAAG